MLNLKTVIGSLFLSIFLFFLLGYRSFAQKPWYIFADLSSEYNDNIYWTKQKEEEDLINRISLGAGINFLEEHRKINFEYISFFEIFSKNSEENSLSHTLSLDSLLEVSQNFKLGLKDKFIHSKEMSEIDIYGVKRKRQNYWKNKLSPSFEYTFGKNRSFKGMYFFNKTRFSRDSSQNSTEHRLETRLEYEINIRHAFTLGYTFTYGELSSNWGFLHGHSFLETYYFRFSPHTRTYISNTNSFNQYTSAKDNKTYNFVAGLEHEFSKRFSCDANGGVYFYKVEDRRTTKSFSGTLSLKYLFERSQFNLVAQRGVREILFTTTNLGLNTYWSVDGTFTHKLSKYLDTTLSVGYSESKFKYIDREDKFWRGSFGINYIPRKWFKAYLLYRYNSLDTNLSKEGYDVNRIMVGVRFTY